MSSCDGASVFTDVAAADALYRGSRRLEQRVTALLGAKVRGRNPIDVTIERIAGAHAGARVVVDVGCGLGGATRKLVAGLRPSTLIAFDRSAAMLEATRRRVPGVWTVQGDFHDLPFERGAIDVVVAAFCLYHSPTPSEVCRGIARCLTASGTAALITKSRDSYREIDQLLAAAGLDPDAPARPSLYGAFSVENAPEIVSRSLQVDAVVCERHEFRFAAPEELVAYARTSPKYPAMTGDDEQIHGALAKVWPVDGVTASSEVAVIFSRRPS